MNFKEKPRRKQMSGYPAIHLQTLFEESLKDTYVYIVSIISNGTFPYAVHI